MILDGNSEKDAHNVEGSWLFDLIKAFALNQEQSQIRKDPFSFICAQHVMGYHIVPLIVYYYVITA